MQSIRMRAQDNYHNQAVDIHVIREDFRQRPVPVEALATDLKGDTFWFKQIDEGTLPPYAPFRMRRESAQDLMDDLYRIGIRPREAAGSIGQLAAVQAHLEDMRLLAGVKK